MQVISEYCNKILKLRIIGEMVNEGINFMESDVIEPIDNTKNVVAVLFDFSNLSFIDSSGIGTIVVSFRLSEQRKMGFSIYNPNKKITELFRVLCLKPIFNVVNTETEALKAIGIN